jgi:hypothetical protein
MMRDLGRLFLAILGLTVVFATGCSRVDQDLEARIRATLAHEWIEAETQDLRVFSTLDPDATRQITAELVALRGALRQVVVGMPVGGVPVQVSLIPSDADPRQYSSLFAQNLRANRMGVKTDSGRLAGYGPIRGRELLYGGYAGLLLGGAPLRSLPLWLETGYADLLSTLEVRADTLWIGKPPYIRQRGLVQGLLPIDALMSLRAYPEREPYKFFSSAWILTHYLTLGHRRGFTDRRPQLEEYLALLRQGKDQSSAFEAAFATTYPQLSEELARYASYHLPQLDLPLADVSAPPDIRIRPLARRDVKQQIGELLLDFARETPDLPRAVRASLEVRSAMLFDEVIRDGAEDAVAYANWASSETTDLARSRTRFAQALERAPLDAEILARLGDQLRLFAPRDPAQSVALREEARGLYRSVLERVPDHARSLAGLGAVALESGAGFEEGSAALERLRGLRRHPAIDLTLARLYSRLGRASDAKRIAADTLEFAQRDPVWSKQAGLLVAELAR